MLAKDTQHQIDQFLKEEIQDLKSWYETSGYPYGALKACYAAVGSVREYVNRSISQPEEVSLFELVRGLEENRYEFLELWYDEFGLASSTYKKLVGQIRRLDHASAEFEKLKAAPLPLPCHMAANGRILALNYSDKVQFWDVLERVFLEEHPAKNAHSFWSSDGSRFLDGDGEEIAVTERVQHLLPRDPPQIPTITRREKLYGRHGCSPTEITDGRGRILYTLVPHLDPAYSKSMAYPYSTVASWSRYGKSFVTEHEDSCSEIPISRMSLWNLETGELTRAWDYWCWLDDFKLSPDGKWLACLRSGKLDILDCQDGRELPELEMSRDVQAIGWSLDGREFFAVNREGVVSVRSGPGFEVRSVIALNSVA